MRPHQHVSPFSAVARSGERKGEDEFDAMDDDFPLDPAELAVIDSITGAQWASPPQRPSVDQLWQDCTSSSEQAGGGCDGLRQLATPLPSRPNVLRAIDHPNAQPQVTIEAIRLLQDELQQRKQDLFSKDGENKILRDRLTGVRGENAMLTQLVQKAKLGGVECAERVRGELGKEIERLKAELAFQEHNFRQQAISRASNRNTVPLHGEHWMPAAVLAQSRSPASYSQRPQSLFHTQPQQQDQQAVSQATTHSDDSMNNNPPAVAVRLVSRPLVSSPLLSSIDHLRRLNALLHCDLAPLHDKREWPRYATLQTDLLIAITTLLSDIDAPALAIDCLCLFLELFCRFPDSYQSTVAHTMSLLKAITAFSVEARGRLLEALEISLASAGDSYTGQSQKNTYFPINGPSILLKTIGILSSSVNNLLYPDRRDVNHASIAKNLGISAVFAVLSDAIATFNYTLTDNLGQMLCKDHASPIRNLSIFAIFVRSSEFLYLFKSDFPTSLHIQLVSLLACLMSSQPFFDQALKLHQESGKTLFSIITHYLSNSYVPSSATSPNRLILLRERVVQLFYHVSTRHLYDFVTYAQYSLPLISRLIMILHNEMTPFYADPNLIHALPTNAFVTKTRFIRSAFRLLHYLVSIVSIGINESYSTTVAAATAIASTLPHPDELLFGGPGATRILKSWLVILLARIRGWRIAMAQLSLNDPLMPYMRLSTTVEPLDRVRDRCQRRRKPKLDGELNTLRALVSQRLGVFDDLRPASQEMLDMIVEPEDEHQLLLYLGIETWG